MSNQSKQISILGCGWLGLPLAKSLVAKGFLIKGSTTTSEKISVLERNKIQPFLIALSATEIEENIDLFLKDSEILIINIPPKLRRDTSDNFVQKIKNIIPFIEKSSVEKVIFVSSTSVFSDDVLIDLITEKTTPNPETESGKQLLETEKLLQSNDNFKTTVIRFGGLIGEDRHPIKFLSGRQNLENPEAPINLIHQTDCIGIIEEILRHPEISGQNDKLGIGEVFNAVAPNHPTRKAYYTQKAIELHLPLPIFDESKPSVGKIISSEKVETVLGYQFQNKTL